MRAIFLIGTLFLGGLGAFAQSNLIPTEARHAVIYDHGSGKVLFSKAGDDRMIPASMTKIMTVQVVFERIKTGEISLEDRLTVSENAWRKGGAASGGSTMFLEPRDTPTVAELLRGVMVLSGNDACIVLAEGLSGTEAAFAEEMNRVARTLGLESATFKNATGLDEDGHRISATDLARLASIQIREFPELYALYAEPAYEWRGIRQPNRNPLLRNVPGADGVKTGHLEISGYGLVGSAERDGERRIIVINGLESQAARAREAERLMRTAFSAFETRQIDPGATLADIEVWLGEQTRVGLRLAAPLELTAHKRAFANLTTEIVYQEPVEAPIIAGTELAELVLSVDGAPLARTPLVATHDVARLGFFGKIIEGLRLKISGPDDG